MKKRIEAHLHCRPGDGWAWLRAEFPAQSEGEDQVNALVASIQHGLEYEGRDYYLASSSKGARKQGGGDERTT